VDILRGRRLSALAPDAVAYTSSVGADRPLVEAVIKINKAHQVMLAHQKIISPASASRCVAALDRLTAHLTLDPTLEDVHMNVEAAVQRAIGEDAAGQLNLAKSRNDQVATAVRMVARERLIHIVENLQQLRRLLLRLSSRYGDTLMPGYTHLQRAQPVTLGHHLLAHHDALARSEARLIQAYARVNLSPLGAGALATSTLPIARGMTAQLLGFDGVVENSVDAVSARDFALELLGGVAVLMSDLSRLGEELVLWSTAEFGFAEVADAYASTSSIMPQKKNSVVAELLRAKTASTYGALTAALTIVKALPYSYNLDLQELTPHLWQGLAIAEESVAVTMGMLAALRPNKERLAAAVDESLAATDLADHLVQQYAIPFRTAHRLVGSLARQSVQRNLSLHKVAQAKLSSLVSREAGRRVKVDRGTLASLFSARQAVERRRTMGGPSPAVVFRMAETRRGSVAQTRRWSISCRAGLRRADKRLAARAAALKRRGMH
jgi:argininosuccinate lyase